ncbi:hypothetical protein, partial [Mycobacterium sp.]|uniref:hypothetical protein n=1 Tax=Mycobacterium sp. TaxID=1785 RepID=UPI0025FA521B
MRQLLVAIAASLMLCGHWHCAPPAHADLLQGCSQPAVSVYVAVRVIAEGQGFFCVYPKEALGMHSWCLQGSGGIGLNLNLGGPFGGGNGGAGVNGIIGANALSCTWRCPNGQLAFQPNPPETWRRQIKVYQDCVPIDPESEPFTFPPPGPPPVDPRPLPAGTFADNAKKDS